MQKPATRAADSGQGTALGWPLCLPSRRSAEDTECGGHTRWGSSSSFRSHLVSHWSQPFHSGNHPQRFPTVPDPGRRMAVFSTLPLPYDPGGHGHHGCRDRSTPQEQVHRIDRPQPAVCSSRPLFAHVSEGETRNPGKETTHQFEIAERLHASKALQDRGVADASGYPTTRRLDDQDRFEKGLFSPFLSPSFPRPPPDHPSGETLPAPSPAPGSIRISVVMDEDHESSISVPPKPWTPIGVLHGRHSSTGGHKNHCRGPQRPGVDNPPTSGIVDQLGQVYASTNTPDRIPWPASGFQQYDLPSPYSQDEQHSTGEQSTHRSWNQYTTQAGSFSGQNELHQYGTPPCSPLHTISHEVEEPSADELSRTMGSQVDIGSTSHPGPAVLATGVQEVEWETNTRPAHTGELLDDPGDRCIAHRVGGSVENSGTRETDIWTLERGRTTAILQLEGTDGHQVRYPESDSSKVLSVDQKRQQDGSELCSQRRRQVSPSEHHSQGHLESPYSTPHLYRGRTPSRSGQHHSRRSFEETLLTPGLAVEPRHLPEPCSPGVGIAGNRPVRNSKQPSSTKILQPFSGPTLRSSRRLRPRLAAASPGIRKPAIRTVGKGSSKDSPGKRKSVVGHTNMDKQCMVPRPSGSCKRKVPTSPTIREPVPTSLQWTYSALRQAKVEVSSLDDLLTAYWETTGVSQECASIMLRNKAKKTVDLYRGGWRGFVNWCRNREPPDDPMLPKGALIVQYLQYKSSTCKSTGALGNIAAAIKYVYTSIGIPPWNGNMKLGHLKEVAAYLGGMRRIHPTQPRYLEFPDLTPCFDLVRSWDNATATEIQVRAKAVFLVRCASLMRSNGSEHILRNRMKFTSEGVHLVLDGTKESQGKQVPVYLERIESSDRKPHALCPVDALHAYISRFLRRNNLWIQADLPYIYQSLSTHRVASSLQSPSIQRIIRSDIFEPAGIPTEYKPGCLRGACASLAIKAGASMDAVLATGRWKDHNVFLQHYYRGGDASLGRRIIEFTEGTRR